MSIITLSGTSQCIKNINFYYDSHDIEKIPPKNVSAITEYGETQGLSHFEHLFISGFSGIGIEIPYYSTFQSSISASCSSDWCTAMVGPSARIFRLASVTSVAISIMRSRSGSRSILR